MKRKLEVRLDNRGWAVFDCSECKFISNFFDDITDAIEWKSFLLSR